MGKCGPKFQNSSNINEVIIPVLNFLIFFYGKIKKFKTGMMTSFILLPKIAGLS